MSTIPTPIETMPVENAGVSPRRIALVAACLLFLNFFYFLFSSGRVRTIDEVSADFQVESIAKHGTAAIPQAVAAKMFYGTMDRFGRPESPYPPGQALVMLPWYLTGRFVGKHLPGLPSNVRDIVSDFFLTGESAFSSALAVAFTLYIFLQLGIASKTSLMAAGILGLATPLAAYSGWLLSEPLAAALFLGAAAVLFALPLGSAISVRRALGAGALLGTAVWVRPTHVIMIPVFLVALLLREKEKGWSAATALVVGAGVGVTLLLWRNNYLHGSLFDFGYPSAAEGGKALNTFETPLTTGLLGFLASPGKSIFLFCPPVFLALAGLPRLWRRDRGLAFLAAAAPVVYLLFFATYTQWEGGYCYGPRYLVPALALLCLAVGPALNAGESKPVPGTRNVRLLAVAVFALGFFVQAIGTTTSFLEADVVGGYYDAMYNYRMGFSPIAMHVLLLKHYLSFGAAPIGRGFDKWWVFLSKAGASTGALLAIAGVLSAGMLISGWFLRQEYKNAIACESRARI
ncbi:MAG TPA: hypothetical protein VFE02_04485 [Candidatus Acidoferrales bacterium]|nr:hypothetical protein [Candidatus Acidoferrales bacterium]